MNFFEVLIFGIVEGFTEFLPISSTAHLLVTGELFNIPSTDFLKTFVVVIQLGAILSVVVLYWKKISQNWEINKRILFAFLPTAVIGFLLYNIIKDVLFEDFKTISTALLVGGIVLIIFELFFGKKNEKTGDEELEKIPYWKSFCIGLAQSLAVIPGVSRAAATILGGMMLGIKRKTIVEFSFLLAIPTMAAASGYDLLQTGASFSSQEFLMLVIGFVLSFVFAIIGVKFLINFIQKKNFTYFGVYRILLGILLFIFLI